MRATLQQDRCTQNDFVRLFADSGESLRWLGITLTGDADVTEEMLRKALEHCQKSAERVFRGWMTSWARRSVIKACIDAARPLPLAAGNEMYSVNAIELNGMQRFRSNTAHTMPSPVLQQRLLGLDALHRFVFVLRAVEGYSRRETSLLLNLDSRFCEWIYRRATFAIETSQSGANLRSGFDIAPEEDGVPSYGESTMQTRTLHECTISQPDHKIGETELGAHQGSHPRVFAGTIPKREIPSSFLTAVFTCLLAILLLPTAKVLAQESTPTTLSLDEAVQLAVANNRSVKIAALEVDKSKLQIAEVKTKRLPSLSASFLGSQLLNEVSFSFPAGAFGNFSGIGPIPSTDTKVTTPAQPIGYVVGQAVQPLSQLYKIQLGVRAQELSWKIAGEKARAERQEVVKDVKQAYYAVLQSESELEATEANVRQYEELDRVVLQRVSQEAALKSDSLDVKAKFANQQYKLIQLRNTLDSRKEYLNHLLGRDIRTDFRTEQVPLAAFEEVDLKLAQSYALTQRPEIKQAKLSLQQAEYDRRMAKADFIPEVGVAFNYASNFNIDVLPRNMTSIGFELKWEPWDWGRRKNVVGQKKITETQAEAQVFDVQSRILMDVNSRFHKLEEARVLIAVTQADREAARQRLTEVTHKYEQQAVLLSDVLKQQAAAAGASDDYQQALLGFWSAKSEFEKALGEDR